MVSSSTEAREREAGLMLCIPGTPIGSVIEAGGGWEEASCMMTTGVLLCRRSHARLILEDTLTLRLPIHHYLLDVVLLWFNSVSLHGPATLVST